MAWEKAKVQGKSGGGKLKSLAGKETIGRVGTKWTEGKKGGKPIDSFATAENSRADVKKPGGGGGKAPLD